MNKDNYKGFTAVRVHRNPKTIVANVEIRELRGLVYEANWRQRTRLTSLVARSFAVAGLKKTTIVSDVYRDAGIHDSSSAR